MRPLRIIPVLLLKGKGLVKTVRFKKPVYIGDPLNSVKILSEKGADEIILLDIEASVQDRIPDYFLIGKIASEALVPFAYGGGVRTIEDARRIFSSGVEKIVVNTRAVEAPLFIKMLSEEFGSQSIIVSIDTQRENGGGYGVYSHAGRKKVDVEPVEFALKMQEMGAGELLINSIDRDGTMTGYDLDISGAIASAVNIPVVACGGAGETGHMRELFTTCDVSGAAAGSVFVFVGKYRAVLINYPDMAMKKNITAGKGELFFPSPKE